MKTMQAPADVTVDRVLRHEGDVVYKGQVLFYSSLVGGSSSNPTMAPASGTLSYLLEMDEGTALKAGENILSITAEDEDEHSEPDASPGPDDERPANEISESPVSSGGSKIIWSKRSTGASNRSDRENRTPRPSSSRGKKKKAPKKKAAARQRQNPMVRLLGCCWMLAGSGLFFLVAYYHYDYLGQLIAMAASTEPGAELDHISAVHGFYSKTYVANMSLGVIAVVAGLALAFNMIRTAVLSLGLWAVALAVSQGLTLYTMEVDNILLGTYLKGALLVGGVVVLSLYRQAAKRR